MLGPILSGLGFIGIVSELIYSISIINNPSSKLSPTDWGLRIFIPTTICLLLIMLGMYMIFTKDAVNGINSAMFYPLIIFMAVGNIALSSIVILVSENIVNWRSN